MQLKSLLLNSKHRAFYSLPLLPLEELCFKRSSVTNTTSLAYCLLNQKQHTDDLKHKEKWEKDLKTKISSKQWENACIMTHKCSLSTKYQEISYKILTQWYITPHKARRWSPTTSDTCWRCGADVGNFLHIWWECPPLYVFWETVIKCTKLITDSKIEFNAATCLINVNELSISRYKKSLSRHLLLAAKTLIPLHWKTTHIPNIKDWLERINYIYKMEEIAAMKKENSTNFNHTWQPWLLFVHSSVFNSLTN